MQINKGRYVLITRHDAQSSLHVAIQDFDVDEVYQEYRQLIIAGAENRRRGPKKTFRRFLVDQGYTEELEFKWFAG